MHFPARLSLKPSRRLACLIGVIHGVAAFSFLLSSLPALWMIAGLLGLVVSLVRALRHARRAMPVAIVLTESGELHVHDGAIDHGPFPALAGSRDLGWAVWLAWQEGGLSRRHLMLMPDALADVDAWRYLRIWLRHKAARRVAGDAADAGSGLA